MRRLFLVFAMSCSGPLSGGELNRAFENVARTRGSVELDCANVTVTDLGGDAYRVQGCALFATYECWAEDYAGEWRYVCRRAWNDAPSPLDGGTE